MNLMRTVKAAEFDDDGKLKCVVGACQAGEFHRRREGFWPVDDLLK